MFKDFIKSETESNKADLLKNIKLTQKSILF